MPQTAVATERSAAGHEVRIAGIQTPQCLLSAQEACQMLRCSKSHFYKVLLPNYVRLRIKHGRKAYFDRHEIEELSLTGWK